MNIISQDEHNMHEFHIPLHISVSVNLKVYFGEALHIVQALYYVAESIPIQHLLCEFQPYVLLHCLL